MRLILLLFAIQLPVFGNRIQVPFVGRTPDKLNKYRYVFFNISIGTPAQEFEVAIGRPGYYTGLFMADSQVNKKYGFNISKSSTFVKSNERFKKINGTDNFWIHGSTAKGKPLIVTSDKNAPDMKFGYFGFERSHDVLDRSCRFGDENYCLTFIESLLSDFNDQVMVFAFEKVDANASVPFNGQLVFGEYPDNLCQKDEWHLMDELFPQGFDSDQWGFEATEFQIGKYGKKTRYRCHIDFENTYMSLNSDMINLVKKVFNIDDYIDPISCNSTIDIVFKFGDKELRVGPKTYLDKPVYFPPNTCKLRVFDAGNDPVTLPLAVFQNHCLALNYDPKQPQIGFTKAVGK